MEKIWIEEMLIRSTDLSRLSKRTDALPVVVKDGDLIFADVVFNKSDYSRVAHSDGKQARVFASVETAVRTLVNAGFNDVVVKYLDAENKPEWIHINDNEVVEWEQKLDFMGPYAPIEELKQHLEEAPDAAPSLEFLTAFIEGYDRAKKEGN